MFPSMRHRSALVMMVLLVLGPATVVLAQHPEEVVPDGSSLFPPYDAAQELWFTGTVVNVVSELDWRESKMQSHPPTRLDLMRMLGMHLLLDAPTGWYDVHTGPSWFLEAHGVRIRPGDRIAVFGAYMNVEGHSVIVAREITTEDRFVVLRDKNGVPLWPGARQMTE